MRIEHIPYKAEVGARGSPLRPIIFKKRVTSTVVSAMASDLILWRYLIPPKS